MKKITLLFALLFAVTGFSQVNKSTIQSYLDKSIETYGLTKSDVSNWSIQGESSSTSTNITNYSLVQVFQGVEIEGTQSSILIKNDEVLRFTNHFVKNLNQKIANSTASLDVYQAISLVYSKQEQNNKATFSISETLDNGTVKLADGIREDLVSAKKVYQIDADSKYRISWSFQYYSLDTKHYWDIRVDASTGKFLYQKDLMINCGFGNINSKNQSKSPFYSFERFAFAPKKSSFLAVTPGSYRVIPFNYESPNHHSFDLISTTGDALASPNGWHNASTTIGGTTSTLIYNYSRGNNVLAQEDADGNNGTGIRAISTGGTGVWTFDFPYVNGVSQNAQPTTYTSAATTNLFYTANIMHDVWYKYGFTEANANFQFKNLGRGGVVTATGDYVLADSQDGYSQTTPTLNNANFAPTADGASPRMQMYMWTAGAPPTNYITVNSPSSIAGLYAATTNVFDTTDRIPVPVAPNGITAELVHYTNDINPVNANPNPLSVHNACVAPTNGADITGKIVLLRRGNCFFSNKVKNAQDAGALAVIVYDTIPNNPQRLNMSSTGVLGITIPAVFVTKEIGEQFAAELANGPVNVKLEVPADLYLYADGDFDNVIKSHEYGHGISNRLVGHGATSCMTNAEQMGEGWSDWFGLMMQLKTGDNATDAKGVGTYAINEPVTGAGIRQYPYSTDMSINPHTLNDSNDTEVHNLGETWAVTLWDLTWAYIGKYGYDPDIYNGTGGNNKVMRLVLDALKLETCNNASYISGRDNIFLAEQNTTGGLDYCMIAEVFRRRGMGLNATSGSVTDALDQVEDFTAFPPKATCDLAVNYFDNSDLIRVYPNPNNGKFNLRINNFVGKVTMQIVDVNGRVILNDINADFNTEKTIDLSNLESGMYILTVKGDKINYSHKIFKN